MCEMTYVKFWTHFAWIVSDLCTLRLMLPTLDPQLIVHNLNIQLKSDKI